MDCLKAADILSAAHDGEHVDPAELAEATSHCHHCTSCASFAETLARVDALIAPPAPAGLVERVLERTSALASAETEPQPFAPAAESPAETVVPLPLRELRRPVSGRLIGLVSAAAVVILALGVSSVALLGQLTSRQAEESARTGDTVLTAPLGAAPESDAETAEDAATKLATPALAPPYIAINGAVWLLAGPAEPQASSLTTVATFTHSLDEGGTPEQRYAFSAAGETGTLFVRAADGTYLEFARVVRTFGRKSYGLMTGAPPLRYGEWPTLPGRFASPLETDGSPTFRTYAKDDLGLDVYVPPTGQIADGFAIAPGTAPTDPAAGNPNWTWWEPLP